MPHRTLKNFGTLYPSSLWKLQWFSRCCLAHYYSAAITFSECIHNRQVPSGIPTVRPFFFLVFSSSSSTITDVGWRLTIVGLPKSQSWKLQFIVRIFDPSNNGWKSPPKNPISRQKCSRLHLQIRVAIFSAKIEYFLQYHIFYTFGMIFHIMRLCLGNWVLQITFRWF